MPLIAGAAYLAPDGVCLKTQPPLESWMSTVPYQDSSHIALQPSALLRYAISIENQTVNFT